MASEKKSAAGLVNLCYLLMKEVGMSEMALQELLNRASAASTVLESLESVRFWKIVIEPFQVLEEKVAMGPFEPAMKLRKRQKSPDNEEPLELDLQLKLFSGKAFGVMQEQAAAVETEGSTSTTAGKGKTVKRMKFAEQNVGPSINEKGKGVLEMGKQWE